MIERKIRKVLDMLTGEYPVITITGPRQSGKTTLAQTHFPSYAYANLEDPEIRSLAENDAREFFRRHPAPVVIDEIQRVPGLLSHIQARADQERLNGRYILTGSQQLGLRAAVSQSLAGRTAILQLLPLSVEELSGAGRGVDRDELLHKGFMPKIHGANVNVEQLYRNYFLTYVERDVRQLVNIRNLSHFEVFLKLLAGRVGQVANLSSLSNDVGVSATTLGEWLSALEASYIVFRLPPYFENFGKRLVKSPKLYFVEVGLAAYLLGIKSPEQAARDPLLGGLFENLVVVEALKARYNAGLDSGLHFFRDSRGLEVDLLLNHGRKLLPIEIKAARSFNASFADGVERFRQAVPNAEGGAVVYAGDLTPTVKGVRFTHFTGTAKLMESVC